MKRAAFSILFFTIFNILLSQGLPNEWSQFLFDDYMSEVKEGTKEKKISEQDFLKMLEQDAVKGLSRQVNRKIEDKTALRKTAINGISSIEFESSTNFSTDVELDLAQTKVKYDKKNNRGYAVAFINKKTACDFYSKQSLNYFGKVESSLKHAQSLQSQGGKEEAKEEVLSIQPYSDKLFGTIEKLIIFEYPESKLHPIIKRANSIDRTMKGVLSASKNVMASIYFDGEELFLDKKNSKIKTSVKNILSKNKCVFTSDKSKADWVVSINAEVAVREMNAYGVHVCDAISELKIVRPQTGLTIHEEEITEKGVSPSSANNAAVAACDESANKISEAILDKIFNEEFSYVQTVDNVNISTNTFENVVPQSRGALPELTIISPSNNSLYVEVLQTVYFEVNSDELLSLNNIEVDINGMRTTDISNFTFQNGKGSFVVRLPRRGQCNLAVKTKNEYGYSRASVVSLKHKNVVSKPRLNILAVGINNYENEQIVDLDYAAKDANDLVNTLSNLNAGIYDKINTKVLLNEKATKEAILEGLSWIESTSLQNDVSIIFIAGHGGVDNRDVYYFFPYEANPNSLRSSCLSYTEFNRTMEILVEDMEAKAILLSDACHSGGAFKTRSASVSSITNDLSSIEDGAFSFASSTGAQKSIEDVSWENGAFTEALIKGINGGADLNDDNAITILELISYSTDEVRKLTNSKQTPTHRTLEGNDFPLLLIPEN